MATFATAIGRALVATLLFVGPTACGDRDTRPARDAGVLPVTSSGDASSLGSCEGREDGETCAVDKHCVDQRCVVNICGDGIVAGDEACDDGNEIVDDACTPSCRRPPPSCGDGTVNLGEECDDGNGNDDDFCTNKCLRQLCRNGVLDLNEECDDGNTDPNDGCSNDCQKIVCGDGAREEQEECDDGNQSENDACSNQCTIIRCGNDRIDPGEACDRRVKRAANGDPKGEPVPEGADCSADCRNLVTDLCKKCEETKCRDFDPLPGVRTRDVFAGCYQPGYVDREIFPEPDPGVPTDAAWAMRCSTLMECVRRNRCDLATSWSPEAPTYDINSRAKPGTMTACFCGEVTPGSGTTGFEYTNCYVSPAGPCVQQIYEATRCTDAFCVEGFMNSPDVPSYHAVYLSQCHREKCFKECR